MMLCGVAAAHGGTGKGTIDDPYTGHWQVKDLGPILKPGDYFDLNCVLTDGKIQLVDNRLYDKILDLDEEWEVGAPLANIESTDKETWPQYSTYRSLNSFEERQNHMFVVTDMSTWISDSPEYIHIIGHYTGLYKDKGDGSKDNPFNNVWNFNEIHDLIKDGAYFAYDCVIKNTDGNGTFNIFDKKLKKTVQNDSGAEWSVAGHVENDDIYELYRKINYDRIPGYYFYVESVGQNHNDENTNQIEFTGYFTGLYIDGRGREDYPYSGVWSLEDLQETRLAIGDHLSLDCVLNVDNLTVYDDNFVESGLPIVENVDSWVVSDPIGKNPWDLYTDYCNINPLSERLNHTFIITDMSLTNSNGDIKINLYGHYSGKYTFIDESDYPKVKKGKNTIKINNTTFGVDWEKDTDKIHYTVFKFVAPATEKLFFYTEGDRDTYAVLYDNHLKPIKECQDDLEINNKNFGITYNVKAGRAYYIGIRDRYGSAFDYNLVIEEYSGVQDYYGRSLAVETDDPFTLTQPSEGDGTANNPFQIGNALELYWFAKFVNGESGDNTPHPDACAILIDDIDLSGVCGPEICSWEPIGSNGVTFSGTFDGAGKTISNLYIDNYKAYSQGLFGVINGEINRTATVKNINFRKAFVHANTSVGIACGFVNTAKVEAIFTEGEVAGNFSVGGVVGHNLNGTVADCANYAVVSSGNGIAGLVVLPYGRVYNCLDGNKTVNSYSGEDLIFTDEELSNGYAAWKMNCDDKGVWGQALGVDQHPFPNKPVVKAATVTYTCDDIIYSNFQNNVTVPEYINNHILEELISKDATCTETGIKVHYECSNCHALFDETKSVPLTEDDLQTPITHNLGELIYKKNTCTETGIKAHYECETCGKLFDETGLAELAAKDIEIPLLDHHFVNCECSFCHKTVTYKTLNRSNTETYIEETPDYTIFNKDKTNTDNYNMFKYVASEDMEVLFRTDKVWYEHNYADTYAVLYDDHLKPIKECQPILSESDYSFTLTYEVKKGRTYYLGVRLYNGYKPINPIIICIWSNKGGDQHGKKLADETDDIPVQFSKLSNEAAVSLADCRTNIYDKQFTGDVIIERSFTDDGWYSISLPFDVEVSSTPFVQVAEFSEMTDNTLKFTSINGTMEAGKGYIVKVNPPVKNPTFYGVTINEGVTTEMPIEGVGFRGVLNPTPISGSNEFGIGSSTTINPMNEGTLKSFRAYYTLSTSFAKPMYFSVDDDKATDIQALTEDANYKAQTTDLYNINGQKVNDSYRGIVIMNGKKVIRGIKQYLLYNKDNILYMKMTYKIPRVELIELESEELMQQASYGGSTISLDYADDRIDASDARSKQRSGLFEDKEGLLDNQWQHLQVPIILQFVGKSV